MLTKAAIVHNQYSRDKIMAILGPKFFEQESLSKYFFTVDPEGQEHPTTRPNGVFDGVTARNINNLKANTYG